MNRREGYGCSVEAVVEALKTLPDGWYLGKEIPVTGTYQSVGNALRHAHDKGVLERKPDARVSGRSFWRLRSWARA